MPLNPETGAEIIDGPPEWFDEAQNALYPPYEEKPREPMQLINPAQWVGMEPPARRWSVDGMVPHGQATLFTGAGSVGKSLVVQLQCTCVALGLPWLGIETEQAVALYISCEDDEDELHRRQKAICEGLGVGMDALDGKLYLKSLVGEIANELATFDERGRISVTDSFRDIEDAAQRHSARFIGLDNTGHFFAGNENDRHQVASFVGLLNGLAARVEGAVVLLGHPNKAGGEYSGSTAWENQVRSRLFMEMPVDADGVPVDPDARVLRRGKSNYAQKGGELRFRWHKWTFVLDDDLTKDQRAEIAANAQAEHDNAIFLKCIDERNKQGRPISESKASRTYAPKEFAMMSESKGIGRARLEQAMDRLFRIGAIERGIVGRYRGEGKDMFGLRRKAGFNSDDLSDDVPKAPSDDVPMTYRRPPKAHTPYTTYRNGAAHEAAAPSPDQEDDGPPAWMDEIPPLEPERDLDWMDNPILNNDWSE